MTLTRDGRAGLGWGLKVPTLRHVSVSCTLFYSTSYIITFSCNKNLPTQFETWTQAERKELAKAVRKHGKTGQRWLRR